MADLLAKCPVCESLVDEEDLFCANCGTEAPPEASDATEAGRRPLTTSRVATYNFECSGCGASMSYDARQQALTCPFCASVDLVAKPDATILAPESVVPFVVDQPRAIDAMRQYLTRGWFRPSDLSRRAAVVTMRAVYVPYWCFSATTHTHWTADTNQTPSGARGDWFPLAGEHHGRHEQILIGASAALTPTETASLCPFDLAAGVPPDRVDLNDVTVEQFSVARKYARPLARAAIEEAEARDCSARYVPGRSRNVHANVRVQGMRSEPLLLPVWIMAYRYRDQVFRFLVNGQTGRASGQAPISWRRIMLLVAVIVIALLALLMMILGAGAMESYQRSETPTSRRVLAAPAPLARLRERGGGEGWWNESDGRRREDAAAKRVFVSNDFLPDDRTSAWPANR